MHLIGYRDQAGLEFYREVTSREMRVFTLNGGQRPVYTIHQFIKELISE